MPEGPEAHTIAKKLKDRIVGLHILSITFYDHSAPVSKMKHKDLHNKKEYSIHYVPPESRVLDVTAYAKRPIITLDTGYICAFLSMTGRFRFERESGSLIEIALGKITYTDSGFKIVDHTLNIWYNGVGPCGILSYIPDRESLNWYFRKYGPDMLASPPSVERYIQIVRYAQSISDVELCVFLLEQQYVSGVGNYLRADIMYHSRLHPGRRLSSLSDEDITRLYNSSITILRSSYEHGGLTMKDYWDPDGNMGLYQRLVYDMGLDPYGNQVTVSIFGDGRKVYWVHSIQV